MTNQTRHGLKFCYRKIELYLFFVFLCHFLPATRHVSGPTSQPGSRRRWSLLEVWPPLRWCHRSEGRRTESTEPLWQDVGPCSWQPRRAGRGWRAEVSSGIWSPGLRGRAAQEGEEGGALSSQEEEVGACLCEWLQSGM